MTTSSRRRYIDWLRGLAVLIMIEAHVFDPQSARFSKVSVPLIS